MTSPWAGTTNGYGILIAGSARPASALAALAAVLIALAGCASAPIGYVYPEASWPTEGGDFQRTGALGADVYPPFQLRWKADAGLAPVGRLAVLDDAVAGCFLRRTAATYALDSGEAVWKRNLRTDPAGGPSASGGLMFISTDIPEGGIQCLSARDGKTVWWAGTGETAGAPSAVGEFLYVCARNGRLLKLGTKDGAIYWNKRVAQLAGSSPAIAGGISVVTTLGDSVVAVSTETGQVRWRHFVGSAQFGSAALWNGRCYLSTNDGTAVCLNMDSGEQVWRRPLGGRCMSGPAVREGSVYFTDLSGQVSCFNAATGSPLWAHTEDWPIKASPTVTSLFVFTAGMGGQVSCYDRETGDPVWTEVVEDAFETPPAIAEMYMILVSSKGTIYCYKEVVR